MEIIRTFHSIGQGGFYTETFDDLPNKPMVVFDCGGKSSKFMKDYINSFLQTRPKATIEAIFISHLHDDHINGLQHLLHRANVKKIFLPQFNPNQLFEIIFYNAARGAKGSNSNQLVLSFIESNKSNHSLNEVSIIQIAEVTGDNDYQNVTHNIQHGVSSQTIASGSSVKFENGWVYIPFNPKSKTPNFDKIKDQDIKEKLQSLYDNTNLYEQATALAKFVKSCTVKQCKELYKKMFGGIHNGQSMTLFSGLRNHDSNIEIGSHSFTPTCNRYQCPHGCDWFAEFAKDNKACIPTNFLYTGDYEASDKLKMKELINFYKEMKVWSTICGLQIPHHGSRKNYAKELYHKRCYAIASASSSNRYRHPNIDTLINIFHQECKPLVVTENKKTKLVQHYKI